VHKSYTVLIGNRRKRYSDIRLQLNTLRLVAGKRTTSNTADHLSAYWAHLTCNPIISEYGKITGAREDLDSTWKIYSVPEVAKLCLGVPSQSCLSPHGLWIIFGSTYGAVFSVLETPLVTICVGETLMSVTAVGLT